MTLTSKHCVPCEGGVPPLKAEAIAELKRELPEWQITDDQKTLTRTFILKDFIAAMSLVDNIATLSEKEGHHPDIHISYNKLSLTLTTHAIHGLSENDFILAAKIDKLQFKRA